jgi:L-malate glycosyltransferase
MTAPAARRLRIFIAHPSEMLTDHLPNGDGLVSFGFIRRLAERGHELHVAAQRVDVRGELPASLHIYPLTPERGASAVDRLVFMARMRVLFERLRRRIDFDLIHQMNPVFTGLSLSLLGARPPLVLGTFVPQWDPDADFASTRSARARPALRHTLREEVSRFQQSRAAGLLIATPQAISRIPGGAAHADRIYEVPHGIDMTRFAERAGAPHRRSVLFLSHVIRRKGVFTLIEAFAAVARAIDDAELVIVGAGDGLEEAQRLAAAQPASRITFLGPASRAEVQGLMHAHSVYCLPSYGEPFATTVLEAMACGLPIVATRAGGLPDLISDEGGRLVTARDPRALAEALIELLRAPDLQASMGRHNRRRIETTFEIEKTVDRLEAAYYDILQARPLAGAPLPAGTAVIDQLRGSRT